jgi:hypothetical protein
MFGEDGPQLVRGCRACLDQRQTCPNESAQFSRGLRDRFNPAQAVIVGSGVVGEHERISGIGFRAS